MICPLLEVSCKEKKQNEVQIICVSANSSWNTEQSLSAAVRHWEKSLVLETLKA